MTTIAEQVESAIDKIRPFLEKDGGNLTLVEVTEDMVARVEFQGACRDCNMSSMTFQAGVTETILKEVPEIRSVEEVNSN